MPHMIITQEAGARKIPASDGTKPDRAALPGQNTFSTHEYQRSTARSTVDAKKRPTDRVSAASRPFQTCARRDSNP
jgi:hypothetical protein